MKKGGVVILMSDKIHFKTKTVIKDKERCYIMMKVLIQQEDITFVNIYAPNIGGPKYLKQILMSLKEEINSNMIIVWDTLTPNLCQQIDHPE